MIKSLIAFKFKDKEIRTVTNEEDGSVRFVAKDVADALQMTWSGATLKSIPKEWKGMLKLNTPSGKQELTFISEPAVYKLAFRSNKPEAETFTNWVAAEVLPSIRRTGVYQHPALAPAVLDTEILKTLIATSQQVLGLRDQLGTLTRLEEYLGHLDITARTMNASVEQLSKITNIESAVRERIEAFRNDFKKANERAYQRSNNDFLDRARLEEEIRRVNARLSAIETLLAEEGGSRAGIMGFLETYLPKYEAANIQTTGNMTPENNPEKFIQECCVLDPFSSVELTFLYKVYKAWSLSRFAQALGPTLFWEYLQDHLPAGVTMEMRKSKRNLIGLKPVNGLKDRTERRDL